MVPPDDFFAMDIEMELLTGKEHLFYSSLSLSLLLRLKIVSEQKYPVNLLLLLLFSISLLFSNSFKIDKISQSCVVKRVSLSSCKALE